MMTFNKFILVPSGLGVVSTYTARSVRSTTLSAKS